MWVEVRLSSFSTSVLDGVSGYLHPPNALPQIKNHRHQLNVGLGGSEIQSGLFGNSNNFLPLWSIKQRFLLVIMIFIYKQCIFVVFLTKRRMNMWSLWSRVCGIWNHVQLWMMWPNISYGQFLIIIIIIIIISGSAAQHGLWHPRPRGFLITHNDAPQLVGLL
jgi:hypothetical protein